MPSKNLRFEHRYPCLSLVDLAGDHRQHLTNSFGNTFICAVPDNPDKRRNVVQPLRSNQTELG